MSDICTERGIYAPDYYNDFRCIADKCKHNCCIGWEICIDEETFSKYKGHESIINTVTECEDGSCFELTGNGRCPHLNDSGLCNIIISHGEEYLSEICQNHPRFFNYVQDGNIEAGLGIACEEACRLVVGNEKPFTLSKVENLDDTEDFNCLEYFSPLPYRDRIIHLIETYEGSFEEKTAFLQDKLKIDEIYTKDEWVDRYLSLEILDPEWQGLLKSVKGRPEYAKKADGASYGKYYEQLLIYFVYRHVSVAQSPDNLRARLAFAILSVRIIRSLFEGCAERSPEKLIDCARRYSAEIEYSEDNTYEIIFDLESAL